MTEAIFSYCGVKVKIDTDRHLGDEAAAVRYDGEMVGHVMTAEYGSQMLSLGGVDHLTGGSKAEGRKTCDALMALCNKQAVELSVDGGSTVLVQAGRAPVVDGVPEVRMRVGCGSATIGMFASQWKGLVDEVVVVDDHITGVVSEHQAGKVIDWPDTGIRIKGHRSTPGRYFKVAKPGLGWGGTDITDPLSILDDWRVAKGARPGLTLLMVSTTGEHSAFYELDERYEPVLKDMPDPLRASVDLIAQNCEPALCTVLFMGGAGGSLRSGVTRNPINLTRSVHDERTRVTVGGAPVYVWPGGGITVMVDVTQVPDRAFGYVPTPALVAPLEFTTTRDEYVSLGGPRRCDPLARRRASDRRRIRRRQRSPRGGAMTGPQIAFLPDGRRLHLNHGPIDLIVDAEGPGREAALADAARRFGTILDELVAELPRLRRPINGQPFDSPTAQRMARAVDPLRRVRHTHGRRRRVGRG